MSTKRRLRFLPEKSGMERVQVVHATSAARQTAMRALWRERSAQTPAQVTASEDEMAAATSAAAAAASREGGA
jgi:UDP-N-acetylglucosamine:LPS N-acetylglucosamine transferase